MQNPPSHPRRITVFRDCPTNSTTLHTEDSRQNLTGSNDERPPKHRSLKNSTKRPSPETVADLFVLVPGSTVYRRSNKSARPSYCVYAGFRILYQRSP